MNPSNNLPGLFHYKAATYGDAIGLTILIGSLLLLKRRNCLEMTVEYTERKKKGGRK